MQKANYVPCSTMLSVAGTTNPEGVGRAQELTREFRSKGACHTLGFGALFSPPPPPRIPRDESGYGANEFRGFNRLC